MKVLVVGGGGREHALCWKIARSKKVDKVYCAPGNAGIAADAELVPIKADDVDALVKAAKKKAVDLVVVGPEAPLVLGHEVAGEVVAVGEGRAASASKISSRPAASARAWWAATTCATTAFKSSGANSTSTAPAFSREKVRMLSMRLVI